jgi:hypothetical protein
MTPGQDVGVKVVDGLPPIGPFIDHHPVAVAPEATTDLGGGGEKPGGSLTAGGSDEVAEMGRVLGRHHEHVRRRLRVEVAKRHHVLVAQHFVGGDLAANDLAEETRIIG